jgi:hypothetical protein
VPPADTLLTSELEEGGKQQEAAVDNENEEEEEEEGEEEEGAPPPDSNLIIGHKCLAERQVFVSPFGPEAPGGAYTNRKAHGAGVCTISPHPVLPHVLATGSYDEHVRIWDTRMLTRPMLVKEVS